MEGGFRIVVEQVFIKGHRMNDDEIAEYMQCMGFEQRNPHKLKTLKLKNRKC